MGKYTVKKLGSNTLVTESNNYKLEGEVDSLGMTTLYFGSSFSLRLDFKNLEKLEGLLKNARHHLIEEAIDQSVPIEPKESEWEFRDPRNPVNW